MISSVQSNAQPAASLSLAAPPAAPPANPSNSSTDIQPAPSGISMSSAAPSAPPGPHMPFGASAVTPFGQAPYPMANWFTGTPLLPTASGASAFAPPASPALPKGPTPRWANNQGPLDMPSGVMRRRLPMTSPVSFPETADVSPVPAKRPREQQADYKDLCRLMDQQVGARGRPHFVQGSCHSCHFPHILSRTLSCSHANI